MDDLEEAVMFSGEKIEEGLEQMTNREEIAKEIYDLFQDNRACVQWSEKQTRFEFTSPQTQKRYEALANREIEQIKKAEERTYLETREEIEIIHEHYADEIKKAKYECAKEYRHIWTNYFHVSIMNHEKLYPNLLKEIDKKCNEIIKENSDEQ